MIYKNQDHPDVRAVLPRRSTLATDRGVLIVAHATHKLKAFFFILIQVRAAPLSPCVPLPTQLMEAGMVTGLDASPVQTVTSHSTCHVLHVHVLVLRAWAWVIYPTCCMVSASLAMISDASWLI